nr:DUF72 domain-containing protein [Pseudenhygromyxa sp. WMMC2535]
MWDRPANNRLLAREGLAVYARHPLLRTVGLDRTYYGPMRAEQFAALRDGLPADFRVLAKAHAECTTVRFGDESWYRSRAGQRNERFLEPEYASAAVVEPFVQGLGEQGGVILFQFPPQRVPGGARSFACRLRDFLAALPAGPKYAVEIRNADLFTPRYVRALEEVGASHCVVELPDMPPLRRQWEASGGVDRPALVMRWMLARHHTYESGREAYAPFHRLAEPNLEVRQAFAEMILAQAKAAPAREIYLIANNKAEGCSPLSVIALAKQLLELG